MRETMIKHCLHCGHWGLLHGLYVPGQVYIIQCTQIDINRQKHEVYSWDDFEAQMRLKDYENEAQRTRNIRST